MTGQTPSARGTVAMGCLALLALCAGAFLWAGQVALPGGIVANGVLEPSQGRRPVAHPTGGVVAEVRVRDGAVVRSGDVMVRFDHTVITAQSRAVLEKKRTLEARIDRLSAMLAGAESLRFRRSLRVDTPPDALLSAERARFDAWRVALGAAARLKTARTASLDQEIAAVTGALQADRDAIAAVRQELGQVEALLAQGLSRSPEALRLRRQAAELEGQLNRTAARQHALLGARTAVGLEFEASQSEHRQKAAAERALALSELAIVTAELARLDHLRAQHILKAPFSGEVIDNRVTTVGTFVAPGQPLFSLIPVDEPRVVTAQVRPADIPGILTGQKVRLRLAGQDRHNLSDFAGRVRRISADADAARAGAPAFFRVEIALAPDQIPADLLPLLRQSGQPVEAFFLTEERSALAYLLSPVTGYFTRAMREP